MKTLRESGNDLREGNHAARSRKRREERSRDGALLRVHAREDVAADDQLESHARLDAQEGECGIGVRPAPRAPRGIAGKGRERPFKPDHVRAHRLLQLSHAMLKDRGLLLRADDAPYPAFGGPAEGLPKKEPRAGIDVEDACVARHRHGKDAVAYLPEHRTADGRYAFQPSGAARFGSREREHLDARRLQRRGDLYLAPSQHLVADGRLIAHA